MSFFGELMEVFDSVFTDTPWKPKPRMSTWKVWFRIDGRKKFGGEVQATKRAAAMVKAKRLAKQSGKAVDRVLIKRES
jgi:hypothetical protein